MNKLIFTLLAIVFALPLTYSQDKYFVAFTAVSYTHLRAHETVLDLVCRLLLEKKKKEKKKKKDEKRHHK